MAEIELVIRIPEELYEIIKNPKKIETMYHAGRLCEAVRSGTPLPKGHGRLIDADAVLEEPFGDTYKDIDTAETIIEADRSEEE